MMPTFRKLEIERKLWGNSKGKLVGRLQIEGRKAVVELVLSEKLANEILQLSKEALVDSVEEAANDFIFEITTAIPDLPKIETDEKPPIEST